MAEYADYDPGPWRGHDHDFDSARARYDKHVGRSYDDAVAVNKTHKDLLPATISTSCLAPMIINIDVTGSMGEWPKTIFSKLPYLELEGQEYLGKDMEISWFATGDAYNHDRYPLQGRNFTKGTDLKTKLEELVIEGGGGGQTTESYELGALYCARNVSMPNAIQPILIFIGDESPYDFVDRDQAKEFAFVTLEKRLSTKEIFEELKRKFSVYLIRKPYGYSGRNAISDVDRRIHVKWAELLGEDHISILPEPGRVVDVIFGILAKETSRVEYFREELENRQKPEQVKTVYKSLATIHAVSSDVSGQKLLPPPGRSVMHKKDTSKTPKS